MNNRLTYAGVTFDLLMNRQPVKVTGRGWAHEAIVKVDHLDKFPKLEGLLGMQLWGTTVIAIESFQYSLDSPRSIILYMNEKKW